MPHLLGVEEPEGRGEAHLLGPGGGAAGPVGEGGAHLLALALLGGALPAELGSDHLPSPGALVGVFPGDDVGGVDCSVHFPKSLGFP